MRSAQRAADSDPTDPAVALLAAGVGPRQRRAQGQEYPLASGVAAQRCASMIEAVAAAAASVVAAHVRAVVPGLKRQIDRDRRGQKGFRATAHGHRRGSLHASTF